MTTYATIPKESEHLVPAAPKESKRAGAIVVAAVLMMFAAGAGAAALSSKTATAPAALAAYDGSGVTWDCAVPDSQVAASNGASSGTIESAGFSVKGNGKTLDSGKETTFKAGEDVTFEIKGNSDEASPYAWSIKASLIDGYLLAHDAPGCARCLTRYCSRTCQMDH